MIEIVNKVSKNRVEKLSYPISMRNLDESICNRIFFYLKFIILKLFFWVLNSSFPFALDLSSHDTHFPLDLHMLNDVDID